MIRLRLQRHGSKKRPVYRVVAADQRSPRDGRYRELIGTYDPRREPIMINLNLDRVDYWLGVGAQPTETVKTLIRKVRAGETVSIEDASAKAREAREAKQLAAADAAEVVVEAAPAPVKEEAAPVEAPAADAPEA